MTISTGRIFTASGYSYSYIFCFESADWIFYCTIGYHYKSLRIYGLLSILCHTTNSKNFHTRSTRTSPSSPKTKSKFLRYIKSTTPTVPLQAIPDASPAATFAALNSINFSTNLNSKNNDKAWYSSQHRIKCFNDSHPKKFLPLKRLIFYYQNVRSQNNKLLDLRNNIGHITPKPNIIVLTETWLQSNLSSNKLGLTEFLCF